MKPNSPQPVTDVTSEEVLIALSALGEDPSASRVEAVHAHLAEMVLDVGKREDVIRLAVNAVRQQIPAAAGDFAFELTLAGFDGGTDATDDLILAVGAPFGHQELVELLSRTGLYPDKVIEVTDLPKELPRDFELPLQLAELTACVTDLLQQHAMKDSVFGSVLDIRAKAGRAGHERTAKAAPSSIPDEAMTVLREADPRPVAPLDPTRPLFDHAGREYPVVAVSNLQIVTCTVGAYGVWDRRTGESLMQWGEGIRLSNERPSAEWIARRRDAATNVFAGMHADAAIARASTPDDSTPAPGL
ncbi:hypothetical protein [Ralstonia sp. ASV6]|uniref:hypothetical protein n=1 Tax=Ralstonia sp. ASV6 TaxID=2795124 RepID=UPI0018EAB6AB|nr:hypothetical protein [Ralstonia sp. ASV6]